MGYKYMKGTSEERFAACGLMVKGGHIKTIHDLLKYIPKYLVAEGMGIGQEAFNKRIHDPAKFEIQYFLSLEQKLGLQPFDLMYLLAREREA